MALQVGERVGDYEVIGLIGEGGMGRVYKVRSIISNREEAMKVLLSDLNSERELAARFVVEIRTLAGLEHPNIAQLRTAFQFQNQLIMIMEFVEGATLEKLATESPIPVDRVVDYATQTLSALGFAHSHGVIHRDIKPSNIMITTHGQVKLMDFGIAKSADEMHLTRPGMTIGSVYYMSPEQVRGGTVDARSDLYSFGITLYEALTGRKPFRADTSFSVLNAHLNEAPVPPIEVNSGLSPELNGIVLRALAKNPDDRFQTAQQFHDALKALVDPAAPRPVPVPAAQAPAFMPVPFAAAPSEPSVPSATSAISGGFTPVSTNQPPSAAPVPDAPPPFAPVAVAKPIPPPSKSHRTLWIGMGALAAILALVAVVWALPHIYSTFAQQKTTPPPPDQTTTQNTSPAPTPDSSQQPAAQTSESSQPANAASEPAAADGEHKTPTPASQDQNGTQAQASGTASPHRAPYPGSDAAASTEAAAGTAASSGTAAAAQPAAAAPSKQAIREVRDHLSSLQARADAASANLQNLRSRQQAQGIDVRSDILAAMSRMNSDLREAQSALNEKDLETANDYLDRAGKEANTLESFLGR